MLFPEYMQCAVCCKAGARSDARAVSCAVCPIAEELDLLQEKDWLPMCSFFRTKGRLYWAGCAVLA